MRTTSRSAKARQGRTHGIVKRYFGPASSHGKDLKCNADIIKEIPYMEKVTPAMLVSAQVKRHAFFLYKQRFYKQY